MGVSPLVESLGIVKVPTSCEHLGRFEQLSKGSFCASLNFRVESREHLLKQWSDRPIPHKQEAQSSGPGFAMH